MADNIVKFPYDACRRVHSKKPRRSKNGTATQSAPADVVHMPCHHEEAVDRRKLRGSPLRDQVATISFGATVVGRMHTAGLKGEPLAAIQPEIRNEWLETMDRAVQALCVVGVGLSQAINTLKALQSETSNFPVNLPGAHSGQPVLNFSDGGRAMIAARPNSAIDRLDIECECENIIALGKLLSILLVQPDAETALPGMLRVAWSIVDNAEAILERWQ